MIRKILKIGSSFGITIPKSLIKKLGLKAGQEVEVKEDNESDGFHVGVSDAGSARDERIAKRTMDFIDRYRGDLEALADR